MTPTAAQLDALGMTRRGLARAMGCSPQVLKDWCTKPGATPQDVTAWLEAAIESMPAWSPMPAGRPKKKDTANG